MFKKILLIIPALLLSLIIFNVDRSYAFTITPNSLQKYIDDGYEVPLGDNYSSWLERAVNEFGYTKVYVVTAQDGNYKKVWFFATNGTISFEKNDSYVRVSYSSATFGLGPNYGGTFYGNAGGIGSIGTDIRNFQKAEGRFPFQIAKAVEEIPMAVRGTLGDGGLLSVALIIFAILLGVGLVQRLKSWFLR